MSFYKNHATLLSLPNAYILSLSPLYSSASASASTTSLAALASNNTVHILPLDQHVSTSDSKSKLGSRSSLNLSPNSARFGLSSLTSATRVFRDLHDGGATCLATATVSASAVAVATSGGGSEGGEGGGIGGAGSLGFVTGGRDGVARLWDLRVRDDGDGERKGRRNCGVEMAWGDGGEFLFYF